MLWCHTLLTHEGTEVMPTSTLIIIIIIYGLSLLQSIPPTTADKQTQAQKRRGSRSRKLLGAKAKSYRLKNYIRLVTRSTDRLAPATSLHNSRSSASFGQSRRRSSCSRGPRADSDPD